MKNYFKDVIKPKWYLILCGIVLFILQCTAILNLCTQFGGEYYLVVPLQLVAGYLNVYIYLMIQKDLKQRHFIALCLISLVLGVTVSFLIFEGLYTSMPGFKGILGGVVMQLTLGMAFYAAINTALNLFSKKQKLQ